MRPVIGVIPLWDNQKDSLWMLPGYMDGIFEAGGLPVILPLTDDPTVLQQVCERADGLLFTGGQDVAPQMYGEAILTDNLDCCPARDAMEKTLFHKAIVLDMPCFGICRGIQIFNVLLGGSLYQDLPTQHPSPVAHHQSPPYDIPCHKVSVLRDSPLFDLVGTEVLSVNSYHHQAIKDLSPLLCPMAISEDSLTEAVYLPGKSFVWAVQWHPEFSHLRDENSKKLFRQFVEACRRR